MGLTMKIFTTGAEKFHRKTRYLLVKEKCRMILKLFGKKNSNKEFLKMALRQELKDCLHYDTYNTSYDACTLSDGNHFSIDSLVKLYTKA